MRQGIPLRPTNLKVARLFIHELTGSDTNRNYKGSGFCDVLRLKTLQANLLPVRTQLLVFADEGGIRLLWGLLVLAIPKGITL